MNPNIYFAVATDSKGTRWELKASHVKSQQAFRLTLCPYNSENFINPFAGFYSNVAYGRMNEKKLKYIWDKVQSEVQSLVNWAERSGKHEGSEGFGRLVKNIFVLEV